MRLLVIEDDDSLAAFIVKGFSEAGFAVDRARDGFSGRQFLSSEPYDIAIVDVMLPGMDGISAVQEIRRLGIRTPVIFLSARRSVDDRIRGLQAGGDDYQTKPFSFAELLARVQAILRRSSLLPDPSRLTVADLSLDLHSREAERGGRKIPLRPREFTLLEFLMRNQGKVVSKTAILSHVWNYSFDPQTNVVDVLVSRLRDKVDEGFATPLIHTVRGAGYVIRAA